MRERCCNHPLFTQDPWSTDHCLAISSSAASTPEIFNWSYKCSISALLWHCANSSPSFPQLWRRRKRQSSTKWECNAQQAPTIFPQYWTAASSQHPYTRLDIKMCSWKTSYKLRSLHNSRKSIPMVWSSGIIFKKKKQNRSLPIKNHIQLCWEGKILLVL